MEQQISSEQQSNIQPEITFEEPQILQDILIETMAIDGICGVY